MTTKARLVRIVFVLCTFASTCSAVPFQRHASLLTNIRRNVHKKQDSSSTNVALALRGGGGVLGTSITKENLATCYAAISAFVGAISMPAPEKAAEKHFGFTLEEGTLAHVMLEFFGSTCVGLAIMSYLATYTETSIPKVVMSGGLACWYTMFRGVLRGSFAKAGFMDYFGVVNLAIASACFYAVASDCCDATLAAKILPAVPTVLGVLGAIDPDLAGKLQGLPKLDGAITTVCCVWFYQSLLAFGILSYALLAGESAFKSIGYASLSLALGISDNTFLRSVNRAAGVPDALSYGYLAALYVIAAGLLID